MQTSSNSGTADMRCAVICLFLLLLASTHQAAAAPPEQFAAVIVNQYPHETTAFTQGLAWDQGKVYESVGLYGQSSLRRVDIATGKAEQERRLAPKVFAEGLTVLKDSIYQLTWKNKLIFQYKKDDFSLRQAWPFPHEGWGLTNDGKQLIVSDGSAELCFLDPAAMIEQRRISVHDRGRNIDQLNELEYVKGAIFANIWHEQRIAVISPADGAVTAWIDLTDVCKRIQPGSSEDVLNGIMHDPEGDRLFVTGKRWPALFEIRLAPVQP